jgi:hypothetical protein
VLILTGIVWVSGLAVLVIPALRSRRPPRLIAGLLASASGALLGEIAQVIRLSHGIEGIVHIVALLLCLGGAACILTGRTRSARARAGS